MPRRHIHRRRTMKGGFLDELKQDISYVWEKTKKATSDAYTSLTGSTSSSLPLITQSSSTGYTGGKNKTRRMKGGFKDNTSTSGLATHAAPFSGETAQPHNWVGGKSKRHRRKHKRSKSHKNRY